MAFPSLCYFACRAVSLQVAGPRSRDALGCHHAVLISQPSELDQYQPMTFTVENFEHLIELTAKLEEKIAPWPRTTSPSSHFS